MAGMVPGEISRGTPVIDSKTQKSHDGWKNNHHGFLKDNQKGA